MSWLREPLLHFLLLGAGLVALDQLRGEAPAPLVLYEDLTAARLAEELGRPPTKAELRERLHARAREEALLAEARRLGLDEGDLIIRRRLLQKMQWLLEAEAEVAEPGEAELEAWLAAHRADHRRPARLSLEQRFFSAERRGEAARADAEAALAEPEAAGDPFPLGRRLESRSPERLRRELGAELADALEGLEPGPWAGPLPSAWGWHLVRVTARSPAEDPPLEEVRALVEADWRAAERARLRAAAEAELMRAHPVLIELSEDGEAR
ncbi:MAG: peptidyl-prolyl cis-trans isomerase [Alphaproteobacteria bacterium]|nr:peptidyl-prolyl cis-trans isomerase [Alphaproteobacteria bacterium]MCB9796081.1 peptidyl-prolyl cis-trans isomerase [Alphaproteobacteria bacterium]